MNKGKFPRIGAFLVLALMLLTPAGSALVKAANAPAQGGPAKVQPQPAVQPTTPPALDPAGVQRLQDGGAKVTLAPQTGAVNFVVLSPAQSKTIAQSMLGSASLADKGTAFFKSYGSVFGINQIEQLSLGKQEKDKIGFSHLTYTQVYHGLPVYGAMLKLHFDHTGQVAAANGIFVPGLNLNTTPTITADQASAVAVKIAGKEGSKTVKNTLMIFRTNLAQGQTGENKLAYEVEVSNKKDQRDLVYIDAQTGKLLNQINMVETLKRVVYNYSTGSFVKAWQEGDPASSDADVQSMVNISGDTYKLYANMSGGSYLSFSGNEVPSDPADTNGLMVSVAHYNDPSFCPNAQWDGSEILVCDGLAVDDVIAHEWSHAYTQYTQGLIYQAQPGALNEAYSDIYGEIVDQINGRGVDAKDTVKRSVGVCTVNTLGAVSLNVSAPSSVAGVYDHVGFGTFGPVPYPAVTGSVVQANDGVGTTDDGCEAISSSVNGKIALVQRGTCNFQTKVTNAQNAGAKAVIVYNNAANGDSIINMSGSSASIPSLLVGRTLGLKLVDAQKTATVSASVQLYTGQTGLAPEDSLRWVMGEEVQGGAIRDMWDPTCFNNPGKVSDWQYVYDNFSDNGGVHTNSGVINHTFALLVDGGTYNGQTITGIGLTKAAAIYWRAESVYQVPTTTFSEHADALEQSCTDLTGGNIYDLSLSTTNQVSAEKITADDCAQLHKATLATQLRQNIDQGNPLLAKNPPAQCGGDPSKLVTLFSDNFDGVSTGWTVSHEGTATYNTPDWQVVTNSLPEGKTGGAYLAVDSSQYGDCSSKNDQSSVRKLISPEITVPRLPQLTLSFDHFVQTETGYDGGNLWIQVNGGAWQQIQAKDFTYNPYNHPLITQGNGNTNPLAGQDSFTSSDGGVITGSWGQSQINLAPYAHTGDKIHIAFYMGQDGCGGNLGWYVDNVQVFGCFAQDTFLPFMSQSR